MSTCADGRRGLLGDPDVGLSTSPLILLGIKLVRPGESPSCVCVCVSPTPDAPEGLLRSAGRRVNPVAEDLGLDIPSVSPLVLGVMGRAVPLITRYMGVASGSVISLGLLVLARGVFPANRTSCVAGEATWRIPREGEFEVVRGIEVGGGVVGKWEG